MKGQVVNILDFVDHRVSITTTQHYRFSRKSLKCKNFMLQRQYVGAYCVPGKLSLWTLKLEFHTIVTSHGTILLLICLKKVKKVETIPSSEIKQKQVAGYI